MGKLPAFNSFQEQHPELISQFKTALEERSKRDHLRTLIVDDEPFFWELLGHMLKGHTNDFAKSAEDGLKLFLEKAPNIVFIDVKLPDDTGHNLAALIRNIDPEAYLVMVTSNKEIDDISAAKVNRVNGYIVKPYSKQKIDETIKQYNSTKRPTL